MNREGAETYLRLLAEAQMRGWLAAAPRPPWAGGPGSVQTRIMAVGQALTAVGALDIGAVEEILADFTLAVGVRQLHDQATRGSAQAAAAIGPLRPPAAGTIRAAAVARLTAQSQSIRSAPMGRVRRVPRPGSAGGAGSPGPADSDPGGPDRFVRVGLTIPFREGGIGGALHLMSFAQTGSGARFVALWDVHTAALERVLAMQRPDLIPLGQFTVTDDRGARYDLDFAPRGDPDWTSEIGLDPAPPRDIRWLDVATPLSRAVRIDLRAAAEPAAGAGPRVSAAELSPGEHLLIMLAERLLTVAPGFAHDLARQRPAPWLQAMTAWLGDIVAALEAADVLSPLSPVPARLAALCASLSIDEHGISVPPAHDLPEPWLSLLAHYQRRKPDTAPVPDGAAALAAVLPELDGIRLALLGLHTTEGNSSLHVLARGMTAHGHPGPLGVDMNFPLSVWLRDSGGRWHATCPAARQEDGRESTVRLRLVPPLTRPTDSVEVLVSGRSGEVRARLPLRWGFRRDR